MAKFKGNTRSFADAVKKVSAEGADTFESDNNEFTETLKMNEESDTTGGDDASLVQINVPKEMEELAEEKKESDVKEDSCNDSDKEKENPSKTKNKKNQSKPVEMKKIKEGIIMQDTKELKIPQMESELKSTEEIRGMNEDTTFITRGTVVHGDIESDGDIEIRGRVEGNIRCDGKLIVGGVVKGDIITGELYAEEANIAGEISARGTVKIGAGSVTVGNISADTAVVAGAVKGDMDVRDEVVFDSTAVVIGNIKSKSVDIRSGAIVEGFCKQVYSNVDVEKYFSSDIESI